MKLFTYLFLAIFVLLPIDVLAASSGEQFFYLNEAPQDPQDPANNYGNSAPEDNPHRAPRRPILAYISSVEGLVIPNVNNADIYLIEIFEEDTCIASCANVNDFIEYIEYLEYSVTIYIYIPESIFYGDLELN